MNKTTYFIGSYFKTNNVPYHVRIDRDGNAQLVWSWYQQQGKITKE